MDIELNSISSQAILKAAINSANFENIMPQPNAGLSSTPAIILKLEHYGSLGIMRSLGRLGIKVFGIDSFKNPPAAVSKFCESYFNLDIDNLPEDQIVGFLLRITKYTGKPALLIPTTDETALLISKYAEVLNECFLLPQISYELTKNLCSKREMYFIASACGVPVPKSFFPQSINEVIELSDQVNFPVMIKGIDGGKLENHTGNKMLIIKDKPGLIDIYRAMEKDSKDNVMIQEYIPFTKDRMWIYNAYFNSASECLVSFTGRKIRQNPIYTGMTSLGICESNKTLSGLATSFLKRIGYCGPVDIDFVFDVRDNKYKMLDVNPRIGASFRLFVSREDTDIARALYLDLTGQRIEFSRVEEGRKWFVEDKDLLSSFRYFKCGHLNFKEWLKSFDNVNEAGYFAADDLKPFLTMWSSHLKRSSMKLYKRINNGIKDSGNNNGNLPRRKTEPDSTKQFFRGRENKTRLSQIFNKSPNSYLEDNELKLNVKKYFDLNNYWHTAVYETSTEPHALGVRRRKNYILGMLDKASMGLKGRAVDIGCGPGAYIGELEKRGFNVVAIDLSTEVLKRCASKLNSSNSCPAFLCADNSNLPLRREKFNLVLCIGVLQYVLSIENTIKELERITAKHGLIVICFENSLAASNISYLFRYKMENMLRKKSSLHEKGKNKRLGIMSKWFLSRVEVPHMYKLYNPFVVERLLRNNNLRKIDSITYGYPLKILRRTRLFPVRMINSLEIKIEKMVLTKKPPLISISGEFYIGIFKKVNDD